MIWGTREARKINGAVSKSDFELLFGSRLEYLDLVQNVSENIGRMLGLDDDSQYWMSLSVRESVTNAILHGNKQDGDKKVNVLFSFLEDRLVIRVQDEGNGFEQESLPDPLDPENLLKPSGRGIFYVRSFMDDVSYRALPEGGWEVRMEKRLNHQQQGDSDDH